MWRRSHRGADAPKTKCHVKAVHIASDNATTQVPTELQERFEKKLKDKLYKNSMFSAGDDLTIRYRFIQLDEGNKLARWFMGGLGNAGEGSVTVESKFFDSAGKEIGKIHTEGKIGSGFLGGSFDNAIDQSSERLAEYMVKNFK